MTPTPQITIKLNKKKFKPLLDFLNNFCPIGSYSDEVARCVFFVYYVNCVEQRNGKTLIQAAYESLDIDFESDLGKFLTEYALFKQKGLPEKSGAKVKPNK